MKAVPHDNATPIRVVHVVTRSFGRQFDGITHRLYSLLSGWRDADIKLDLWGTDVRPLNMGSGDTNYRLAGSLWPADAKRPTRRNRLVAAARQLGFLVASARRFDIAHFYHLGWDTLVSPIVLHLAGKKAIFTSSLYGSDDPSAIRNSRGGRLAAALLKGFDGVVAVSPRLAEEHRKAGFRNVLCLPNFLALSELARGRDEVARMEVREKHSIPADAVVLLFVGAVIRRKGVDLLAECFARLATRHDNVWLVAVGPIGRDTSDGEPFSQAVRTTVDRAGATSRVIWVGTVRDRNAMARYYSAADVFVLPTRAEGLANVLVEATAIGLPIVATDLKGITDVTVADGENGFLIPGEDIDALTHSVERLVADPILRARMGKAARARSKRFGFEDYCRQLRAFYLKVAGDSA
jgi:glycosyltransferase involved in cell wall biosynthesis